MTALLPLALKEERNFAIPSVVGRGEFLGNFFLAEHQKGGGRSILVCARRKCFYRPWKEKKKNESNTLDGNIEKKRSFLSTRKDSFLAPGKEKKGKRDDIR